MGDTVQAYEYTRQDGTIEHAANREEAIKLCPVLGQLAMEDPETANVLLDLASLGQAKMAEEASRPEPINQARPDASPKEPTKLFVVKQEASSNAIPEPEKITTELFEIDRQSFLDPFLSQDRQTATDQLVREPSTRYIATHEQHSQDTERVIVEEVGTTILPSSTNPIKIKRQPFRLEGLEAEHKLPETSGTIAAFKLSEFAREQVVAEPETVELAEQIDNPMPDTTELLVTTEPSDLHEEYLVVEPEITGLVEQNEVAPVITAENIEFEAILDDEPDELLLVYEDFSETLRTLVDVSNESELDLEDEPARNVENSYFDVDKAPEVQPLPVVVTVVAERLNELENEEKEAVALVLTDIVEIARVVKVLAAEETEAEPIEAMRVELEEAIVRLFEQVGMEYEEEDVAQFIAVLLRPDFQPKRSQVAEMIAADLERDGTHEAKYSFPRFFGGLADTEDRAQKFLGKLTLLYVTGSSPKAQTVAT